MTMPSPLILFGAFDRHNFGDLPGLPTCVLPAGLAPALLRALAADAGALQCQAQSLSAACRAGLASLGRAEGFSGPHRDP